MFLNALPGFAIAAQALMPKYLVEDVFEATGVPINTRYLRLGLLVGGYLFVAIFMRMFAWYGSYRIFTKVRENIILELRARFFRHINNLCLRFHGKHSSGELVHLRHGFAPGRDRRVLPHDGHERCPTPSARSSSPWCGCRAGIGG